jgi:hypothetical protein
MWQDPRRVTPSSPSASILPAMPPLALQAPTHSHRHTTLNLVLQSRYASPPSAKPLRP